MSYLPGLSVWDIYWDRDFSSLGWLFDDIDTNFEWIWQLWNWYLVPIVNAHESSIDYLLSQADSGLEAFVHQINNDLNALESEYYGITKPMLSTLYTNVNEIMAALTTTIIPVMDILVEEVDAIQWQIDVQIEPALDEAYNWLYELQLAIDDNLQPAIQEISNRTTEIEGLIEDDIFPLIDDIELSISSLDLNLRALITSTQTEIEADMDALREDVNTVTSELSNEINRVTTELQERIDDVYNQINSGLFIPLAILYAILNDDLGTYQDYQPYWQLFASKLLS